MSGLPDTTSHAWKKYVILGIGVVGVALFFALDLNDYLTLETLKQSRQTLRDLQVTHPFLVGMGYFCFYIVVVALNLPGATVMTLAAGALFGFWMGSILVSFASAIGATIACFVARYLFRDLIKIRFARTLDKIDQGIVREGALYLFTLRLIPVFPFFAINLLMGLTKLPLSRFYWVSQLGMLPGTMVYVNAGRELGKLESLQGILSPSLIIAFVIVGLFPLATKKIMAFARKKSHDDT
ncbi:TVP38/TMEM64 family protein [Desulfoplanes formicivorans]|uniref:TVP38/TMEM64 family membrane protein n=1 Tax=Desulfoplanes formicivorans TaxID=1592317 RepID=A0A194AJ15_9BACT|nr:TVP38/TMEM64 family protein [Desulfoplanes formicivorans]GAU09225.1 dihydrolipoamide dehydrogenase [Desulfoplanes formicivorans]